MNYSDYEIAFSRARLGKYLIASNGDSENAINAHYKRVFSDSDWIRHQLTPNGMSDKVVSSMTLGFWIHLFSRRPFALGGQSILRVFPQRDKGLGQRVIYNELKTIKTFRNRIAHHEAICFDPRGVKSSAPALANYLLLTKYARFLGYDEALLFDRLDTNPYCLLKEIDNL